MATLIAWDRRQVPVPEASVHTDRRPPWAVSAWNPPDGAAARVAAPAGRPAAPAGSAGSGCQAAPGPVTETARPPASSTPSVLAAQAADRGRAPSSGYGADSRHCWPSRLDHAPSSRARRPVPATRSAALAWPARASCSTVTGPRASAVGSRGPTRVQRPACSAKMPAWPGRAQAPASSTVPDGAYPAAVSRVSPQLRAAAATAPAVASRVQAAPGCALTSTPSPLVSAISPPSGAAASALTPAASGVSSRPSCTHLVPLSALRASGEKASFWLGRSAATSDWPPVAATDIPPLLATPGGVASCQAVFLAGRTKTCQKSLCAACEPPMTSTAQLPPG